MSEQNPLNPFEQLIVDTNTDFNASRRAAHVVDLAILSLLIDAGVCTVETAIRRLQDTQTAMPDVYQSDEVSTRISVVATKIRDYGPKS